MKITRVINVAALMLGVLLLCQCTKEEKSAVQPQANVPATVKMAYIDSDSLAAKYNFAKDIFEANQRAQNKLENVRQQKAAELLRVERLPEDFEPAAHVAQPKRRRAFHRAPSAIPAEDVVQAPREQADRQRQRKEAPERKAPRRRKFPPRQPRKEIRAA